MSLDLVCPSPLVPIARLFPDVGKVFPWNGQHWSEISIKGNGELSAQMKAVDRYWADCAFPSYNVAYNLNNHPRGVFLAHLLGERVVGPGEYGPLHPAVPAWAQYLTEVARNRGQNRIHLADAFCGLCGVPPPDNVPRLEVSSDLPPEDLKAVIRNSSVKWVALVLGAGDRERQVPLRVWGHLIESILVSLPESHILLIGGSGEREISLALDDRLSSAIVNRVVNACGRTTLPQLHTLLSSCHWVIGSDTGPFHLGVLAGARGIGWYFSRARVHETGPYGTGHFVWQRQNLPSSVNSPDSGGLAPSAQSDYWPVAGTVDLMEQGLSESTPKGWTLWESHRDQWGMYYQNVHGSDEEPQTRKQTWKNLSSHLSFTNSVKEMV